MSNELEVWNSPNGVNLPANISEVHDLIHYNKRLSPREVSQVQKAYDNELYDMAAEYVWTRAINVLKERVLSLGEDFVLEMLGRSETDSSEISEIDTINLAADLGFINKIAKIKFTQVSEMIHYHSSRDAEEEMDIVEVQRSIKACMQYVLGFEENDFQFSFNDFRNTLKQVLIKETDDLFKALINSPYFYKRTTLRTFLNLSKSSKGGELDNVLANMALIIPEIWDDLLSDDRYPIGIAYSEAVNQGDRKLVTAIKNILMKVNGFDYVPENLRSLSFIEYAKKLQDTHFAFDNFYNEPAAARALASMGTSIPTPALGVCISAVLLSKLGNNYGVSRDAQVYVDEILKGLTPERWQYYLNNVLPGDEDILIKLSTNGRPVMRWCELVKEYKLNELEYKTTIIKKFIDASYKERSSEVVKAAKKMYEKIR
ncbi:hypothetical protein ACO11K_003905 [Bacillus cytotoxicus]